MDNYKGLVIKYLSEDELIDFEFRVPDGANISDYVHAFKSALYNMTFCANTIERYIADDYFSLTDNKVEIDEVDDFYGPPSFLETMLEDTLDEELEEPLKEERSKKKKSKSKDLKKGKKK